MPEEDDEPGAAFLVDADQAGRLTVSRLDAAGYADMGVTHEDGVTFTYADDEPPRSFAQGGMVRSFVATGQGGSGGTATVRVNRTPAEQAGTVDDVLAQIDAAVQERCACGCGAALTGAVSAYFASPECQSRWHAVQVDDPGDVYHRRDAAPVYVEQDDRPVPLYEPGQAATLPPARPYRRRTPDEGHIHIRFDAEPARPRGRPSYHNPPPEPEPAPIVAEPGDDEHGVAYRRLCPGCNQRVMPRVYELDSQAVVAFGINQPVRLIPSRLMAECVACALLLPGPGYVPTVRRTSRHMVLELHNEVGRTTRSISHRQLATLADASEYVDSLWRHMELELHGFRSRWIGASRAIIADYAIASQVIDPRTFLRNLSVGP